MKFIRDLGPFVAVLLAVVVAGGLTAGAWLEGVTVRLPLDARWSMWWASEVVVRAEGFLDAPVAWYPVGTPFYTTLPGVLAPLFSAPFTLGLGSNLGNTAFVAVIAGGNVLGAFVAAQRLTGRVGASLAAALLYGLNPAILDALRWGELASALGWFLPWVLVAFWELPGSEDPWADAGEVAVGLAGVALASWSSGAGTVIALAAMGALWMLRADRVDAAAQAVRVAIVSVVVLVVPSLPFMQMYTESGAVPNWFFLTTDPVRIAWTAMVIGPAALTLPRARPWALFAVVLWGLSFVPHVAALSLVIHACMAMAAAVALGGMSRYPRRIATLAAAVACLAESARPPGLALAVEAAQPSGEALFGGAIVNLPMRTPHDDRLAQTRHGQSLLVGPGVPPAGWLLFVQRNALLATLWRVEGGGRAESDVGLSTLHDAAGLLTSAGFRWITVGEGVSPSVISDWSAVLNPLLGEGTLTWDLTHLRKVE